MATFRLVFSLAARPSVFHGPLPFFYPSPCSLLHKDLETSAGVLLWVPNLQKLILPLHRYLLSLLVSWPVLLMLFVCPLAVFWEGCVIAHLGFGIPVSVVLAVRAPHVVVGFSTLYKS